VEFGLRWDQQEIDGAGLGYDDSSLNASLGGLWQFSERLALVGQVVRSERHPSATELYADGPHAATRQFEVGDPDLRTERGVTADVGLRLGGGAMTGEIRAFASRYDGYIYLSPTGAEEDGLPVYQYLQRDADFWGLEFEADLPLGEDSGFMLGFTGTMSAASCATGATCRASRPCASAWRSPGSRATSARVSGWTTTSSRTSHGERTAHGLVHPARGRPALSSALGRRRHGAVPARQQPSGRGCAGALLAAQG
jgi:outer membrane receptor protein involved in Fe transport